MAAAVYLSLIALLYIPAVQHAFASFVSGRLTHALHTEVGIGRVGIGFPNRLVLDDVNIQDLEQQELFHAARLSAKIELSPLLQGRISIANIQLYGFHIQFRQQEEGSAHNFQFLVDALSGGDGPSDLDLRINSIFIRRGRVSYHRPFRHETPERFNPDHIELSKLNATVSLKACTRDSLNLYVKNLSFEEQSGFRLKQLTFRFSANRRQAELTDFGIELPRSELQLEPIRLRYRYDAESGRFSHPVFRGRIARSRFFCQDFAAFYPPLGDIDQRAALCLEAGFEGDDKHLSVDRMAFYTPDRSISLHTPFTVSQLQNAEQRAVNISVRECNIDRKGMADVCRLLPADKAALADRLRTLGAVRAQGRASLGKHRQTADLHLNTDLGEATAAGTLTDNDRFEARVQTKGFELGKFLDREEEMGLVRMNLSGQGRLQTVPYPDLCFKGNVQEIVYRKYAYKDITLDLDYRNGGFEGHIDLDDPNAAITADGVVNFKARTPYIKGTGSIRHFNPHALQLTQQYAGMDFHTDIDADFEGDDPSSMDGYITLSGLGMHTDEEEDYEAGDIQLEAGDREGMRHLTLRSDFVNAEVNGRFTFRTLIANSKKMLNRYIPTFVKMPKGFKESIDDMTFSMDIDNTEPIEKFFGIPLQIDETAHLEGRFSSETDELDFTADLPSLTYDGQHLTNITVRAGQQQDSIAAAVRFRKRIGTTPVDFRLQARAANDNIYTGLRWDNHGAAVYRGAISADTQFTLDEDGRLNTDVRFRPTQIVINDSVWNVHASSVHIVPGLVDVDHFTVEHGARHLVLHGNVSAEDADTLTADLQDVNLEYIFNIIDFHAVEFTGRATGRVYANRLMKSPQIDARLSVADFCFNEAYLGNMNIRGGWTKEQNAITLNARMADPAHRSATSVDGTVRIGAPPRGGLDLMIKTQNIDLYFLNQYTSGIFTNLTGRASGWTRVFGPFKNINLEGDMLVNEADTRVNAIGVDFHIENDSVILRPDNIYFRGVKVYDRQGSPGGSDHYAVVNGVLQHSALSNMSFHFDIDAFNVLGYDQPDFGDDVFCGTAYMTGRMNLEGKPGELNINIDARPEAGTVFTYNQSSPTTLTSSQFITYVDHSEEGGSESVNAEPAELPEPESDMRINFNLDLVPDATMRILMDPKAGDYIALNGHGNIRATYYNKGRFMMYGTYTVDHGTYKLSIQDVIRKDFTFNPGGTIVFGGLPFMADLNLQAVYTVPSVSLNDLSAGSTFSQNNVRVNCLMNLTGKAQAPRISFDFDLPNVNEDEKQMVRSLISTEEEKNMQVVYLLGIGRFYTYDNSTGQNQSSAAMKSLLSSTLSSQLNQMFSNILGNNSNWNIGTNLSTGEQGWSDMDVEGLLSGRLLNNRLLINGNFGYRDKNTATSGNFIGDFDLQWLLTKNGNISLKAYSKTNDRYFTKSSLTTQGIGVVLKRDFQRWRTLLRSLVPQKRREARERKRAERKQRTGQQ